MLLLVVIGLAFYLLASLLHEYSLHDISREIRHTPARQILSAILLCIANYIVLTAYDALAVKYIGQKLSYWKTALTAIIGYSFSNTVGFALLSGGTIRYRFYTAWGIKPANVIKIVGFSGAHFWGALALLAGASMLLAPDTARAMIHINQYYIFCCGIALAFPTIAYLLACAAKFREFSFFGTSVCLPSFSLALSTLTVATLDWLLAAGVLYVLLWNATALSFTHVLCAFFISMIAGVASHVPGGLGVFETSMIFLIGDAHHPASIIGAIILFRAIYYVLPFLIGLSLLVAYETRRNRIWILSIAQKLAPLEALLGIALPPTLALLVFFTGSILLISGSTPTAHDRMWWTSGIIPLSLIESSHFINSIVAVLLMTLAWGIRKRVNNAYYATLGLLTVGVFVSLTKGFDYEEALLLLVTMLLVLPSKKYFHRKGISLLRIDSSSLLLMIFATLAAVWIGLFAYKHVEYSHELWWQFEEDGEASRFLRGSLGAALVLMFLCARRFFKPQPFIASYPDATQLSQALTVIKQSDDTRGFLALLRDKHLLLSENKQAFIMYGISGRSWISMGDPVGSKDEARELVWNFRELCDGHGGFAVFYEVCPEYLPLYLDCGLKLLKLGEEGIVDLPSFTMQGAKFSEHRHILRRNERDGYSFEIRPSSDFPALLPRLKEISDAWLNRKSTREKGFSLGFFDQEYLSLCPLALILKNNQIKAFANMWITESKAELSVDLMRYGEDAPYGVMDFLFVNLMIWGREQGYRRFALGMAPLAGLETRRLASFWSKAGAYLYRHGEHFYNFEGLRHYKNKFNPSWEPRYLAHPGGLYLPIALANTASLISGGVKGIVAK